MEKNQALTNEFKILQSKFDEASSHHETLLGDHDKLGLEFLKRKQELESLKVVHDDLRFQNDSLLAQQIRIKKVLFLLV